MTQQEHQETPKHGPHNEGRQVFFRCSDLRGPIPAQVGRYYLPQDRCTFAYSVQPRQRWDGQTFVGRLDDANQGEWCWADEHGEHQLGRVMVLERDNGETVLAKVAGYSGSPSAGTYTVYFSNHQALGTAVSVTGNAEILRLKTDSRHKSAHWAIEVQTKAFFEGDGPQQVGRAVVVSLPTDHTKGKYGSYFGVVKGVTGRNYHVSWSARPEPPRGVLPFDRNWLGLWGWEDEHGAHQVGRVFKSQQQLGVVTSFEGGFYQVDHPAWSSIPTQQCGSEWSWASQKETRRFYQAQLEKRLKVGDTIEHREYGLCRVSSFQKYDGGVRTPKVIEQGPKARMYELDWGDYGTLWIPAQNVCAAADSRVCAFEDGVPGSVASANDRNVGREVVYRRPEDQHPYTGTVRAFVEKQDCKEFCVVWDTRWDGACHQDRLPARNQRNWGWGDEQGAHQVGRVVSVAYGVGAVGGESVITRFEDGNYWLQTFYGREHHVSAEDCGNRWSWAGVNQTKTYHQFRVRFLKHSDKDIGRQVRVYFGTEGTLRGAFTGTITGFNTYNSMCLPSYDVDWDVREDGEHLCNDLNISLFHFWDDDPASPHMGFADEHGPHQIGRWVLTEEGHRYWILGCEEEKYLVQGIDHPFKLAFKDVDGFIDPPSPFHGPHRVNQHVRRLSDGERGRITGWSPTTYQTTLGSLTTSQIDSFFNWESHPPCPGCSQTDCVGTHLGCLHGRHHEQDREQSQEHEEQHVRARALVPPVPEYYPDDVAEG